MGWNSGTILFDTVVEEVLTHNVESSVVLAVATSLVRELKELDWDGACDSKWWDHPKIGRMLGNTFDGEEEYDDDWWQY